MNKTIIMVHGRSWKPAAAALSQLWIAALRHGIERDFGSESEVLGAFERAAKDLAYFGDVSNRFLRRIQHHPPPIRLSESFQQTLTQLRQWRGDEFVRDNYINLPGKDALKEVIADTLSPLLRAIRLSDELISAVAPDIGLYWRGGSDGFATAARAPLISLLTSALHRGDRICIIAHSLGSMIAYDVLWHLSHAPECRELFAGKDIDLLITCGSPLADATVQSQLFGANKEDSLRYPNNISTWHNFSAEDDYISHDSEVANDYHAMTSQTRIHDHVIFNLALREGISNPHHSSGYLVHPQLIHTLATWLRSDGN